MIFSRNFIISHDSPRIITYINIRLISLYFSLWKDVFNHRNISCVFFFNCDLVYFLINIYLDSLQTVLKYFKNTKVKINNVLFMIEDFNIRDCSWYYDFIYHFIHKDTLIDITVLQSIPPGYNIEKDKEYDDMIGCVIVVSVSASCSRYYNLALS